MDQIIPGRPMTEREKSEHGMFGILARALGTRIESHDSEWEMVAYRYKGSVWIERFERNAHSEKGKDNG